jgi:two-component system NtrC family sensor kinase
MSRVDAQLLQSAKLVATGKLAASIAHEINNPLQSVQSCIYLVADAVGPEGPNRQYLDIAREELDRIAKIVQRLIDFYRPSQEGQKPTDLNDLLENVLALMSKRLQQGNVKIVRSLASDLPPATVVADQIKQVFFNLMLNALEAMPQGGQMTVSSRPVKRAGGAGLEIVFKDTGTGIASEILGRIFDPFYTTKVKGTGLGLSISHDIVERHGGSIRVETQVGSGSVFTVYLPVSHEKIEKAAQ